MCRDGRRRRAGHLKQRRRKWLLGGALLAALLAAGAAGGLVGFKLDDYKLDDYESSAEDPVLVETISGIREFPDGAYSYVVTDGVIRVYDIEQRSRACQDDHPPGPHLTSTGSEASQRTPSHGGSM